jgi:hypothetical protein
VKKTIWLTLLIAVYAHSAPPTPAQAETIAKIKECIRPVGTGWTPACPQIDFRVLDGVKKSDVVSILGKPFVPGSCIGCDGRSPVVCEEDATAEHCVKLHWRWRPDQRLKSPQETLEEWFYEKPAG